MFLIRSRQENTLPAVDASDGLLSYGELLEQSAIVANALMEASLPASPRVGIYLAKGRLLPPALLGALQANGCYIPLDTTYPPERIEAMIAQASIDIVLQASGQPLPIQTNVRTLAIDQIVNCITPTGFQLTTRDPRAIAYTIFTSGSTGRPKAVEMPDSALSNLLAWQSDCTGIDQPGRVLQFAPVSFDVHFQEFFHTWSLGGTVVIPDDHIRKDPQQLLKFIEAQEIQTIYLPYIALAQLAEAAQGIDLYPASLSNVITAGEQLVVSPAIRKFFGKVPHCRLHNQYGPSETHVVTAHTLSAQPADWPEIPAIGKPVSNCWVRIVNENLEPAGPDGFGEMLLGGECLAKGYYDDPKRTTERFIDTPWGRAYRSGDLGRVDELGDIHYLGRVDNQVKIRGHRVEPGEIEALILQHPFVNACSVTAHGEAAGDRRLVAYIALDGSKLDREDDSELGAWQAAWDATYSIGADVADIRLDIRGWNSSYTGEPLPADQMTKWVEGTAERIERLAPQRILELGCGTGLILFALEQQFQHYCATDYSGVTIAQLGARLEGIPELKERVSLKRLAAHELAEFKLGVFDTVIINSLTQHFGSLRYLREVIKGAVDILPEGGHVFVGDVTSKNTRDIYFGSVAVAKGSPDLTGALLLDEIAKANVKEHELVIEPLFFYALRDLVPRISDVDIQLKPGNYRNELSQFRYDVCIRVGETVGKTIDYEHIPTVSWIPTTDITGIANQLSDAFAQHNGPVRVTGVLNVRTVNEYRILSTARREPDRILRTLKHTEEKIEAVDPNLVWEAVKERKNLRVQTLFSKQEGCFDILVTSPESSVVAHALSENALKALASQPVDQAAFEVIRTRLKSDLEARLPEYMMPSRFVPVTSMPLTPSGKVDRRRLPEPSNHRPTLAVEYVEAQNEMQRTLCKIWRSQLELDNVGILDNFFDLGGTSVQSLRVTQAISAAVGYTVPIVTLFQCPTIIELSAQLQIENQHATSRVEIRQDRAHNRSSALARSQERLRKRRRG